MRLVPPDQIQRLRALPIRNATYGERNDPKMKDLRRMGLVVLRELRPYGKLLERTPAGDALLDLHDDLVGTSEPPPVRPREIAETVRNIADSINPKDVYMSAVKAALEGVATAAERLDPEPKETA